MRYVAAAIILAACGHKPPAPAPAPSSDEAAPTVITPPCEYAFMVPTIASGGESGGFTRFEQAQQEADAGHRLEAARDFLACARAYAALTTDTAAYDAHVCYYDAIYAYAMAGAFAREGKAALEDAAAHDPKNASYIQEQLVHPPEDCATK